MHPLVVDENCCYCRRGLVNQADRDWLMVKGGASVRVCVCDVTITLETEAESRLRGGRQCDALTVNKQTHSISRRCIHRVTVT